jgi:AcrR family transcriptional regulator
MKTAQASAEPVESMREALLAAATGVLEGEGFDRLSVRSVAAAAGCSIGTVYNYFADFDELVLHLNAETVKRLAAAMTAAAARRPQHVPRALVDSYFDFLEAEPRRWQAMFQLYPPKTYRLPAWYRRAVEAAVAAIAAALLPSLGAVAPRRRRDLIVSLWAALHGLSMLDQQGKLSTVAGAPPARSLAHLLVAAALRTEPS